MIQRLSSVIVLFCFSSIALGQQIQEKYFQLDIDSLLTKVYENVNLSVLPTNYLIDKSVGWKTPIIIQETGIKILLAQYIHGRDYAGVCWDLVYRKIIDLFV